MLQPIVRVSLLVVASLWVANATATTITIVNTDGPGVGLNDTTPVDPTIGNPGTTLGAQALNVFQAAADYWESRLDSDVEILVDSSFAPLNCTALSGTLGSAGPLNFGFSWTVGTPAVANRLYAVALANSLAGRDLDPSESDIRMRFNGLIGTENCLQGLSWNYEIGTMPVSDGIDLLSTAIHELGHGLGFLTLFDPSNGFGTAFGPAFADFDDTFSANMFDETVDLSWSQMTPSQRNASSVNTDYDDNDEPIQSNLVWSGELAVAEIGFLNNGLTDFRPQLYAPDPYDGGSSNSHWDVALAPDEIMEPSLTMVNEPVLTTKAFYDSGWQGTACLRMELPHDTWRLISLDCIPPDDTIGELFVDDIDGELGDAWSMFGYNAAGGNYDPLTSGSVMESGVAYWIIQHTGAPITLEIPRASTRTPLPKSSEDMDCESALGCVSMPLTVNAARSNTWQLIGNPFNTDLVFEDIRITAEAGSCNLDNGCTPAEAQAASMFFGSVFLWDGGAYQIVGEGGNNVIPRNFGVWAATMENADGLNPVLHLPKDPYAGRLD